MEHTESSRSISNRSDEKRIVLGSQDKSVRVWEPERTRWCREVIMGHAECVASASILAGWK